MTDKRQKMAKVKCKRDESLTKQSCGMYSSLEEVFEFCWSSFADEHNTFPKSTRRHVKLNKFAFGTPWLPDLLCKHWFTSSVWNFCRWVADVPPRKKSLSGDEKGETSAVRRLHNDQEYYWPTIYRDGAAVVSTITSIRCNTQTD